MNADFWDIIQLPNPFGFGELYRFSNTPSAPMYFEADGMTGVSMWDGVTLPTPTAAYRDWQHKMARLFTKG